MLQAELGVALGAHVETTSGEDTLRSLGHLLQVERPHSGRGGRQRTDDEPEQQTNQKHRKNAGAGGGNHGFPSVSRNPKTTPHGAQNPTLLIVILLRPGDKYDRISPKFEVLAEGSRLARASLVPDL